MLGNNSIPDIEAVLIGAWASENNKMTLNFFPAPDIKTPGQLDIFHNDTFDEHGYRIHIKDNKPHINIINSSTNATSDFIIEELNKEQHVLKITTEAGELITLHKK